MMTREEAINRIENHMEVHGIGEYPHIALKEALDMAITALRPVSRERVEKVWRAHWNESVHLGGFVYCSRCGYSALEENNYTFCPKCGSPLTDEAVEMMLERLEALHEIPPTT